MKLITQLLPTRYCSNVYPNHLKTPDFNGMSSTECKSKRSRNSDTIAQSFKSDSAQTHYVKSSASSSGWGIVEDAVFNFILSISFCCYSPVIPRVVAESKCVLRAIHSQSEFIGSATARRMTGWESHYAYFIKNSLSSVVMGICFS